MSKKLIAQSPIVAKYDGKRISLTTVEGYSLVVMAIPKTEEAKIIDALKSQALDIPNIGNSITNHHDNLHLWRFMKEQLFVFFKYSKNNAEEYLKTYLNNAPAFYTDQSDSWSVLRLSGSIACRTLSRITMIDISPNKFPIGSVTRTSIEHMASIVYKEGAETFLVLCLRSFAKSMFHVLETTIKLEDFNQD